MPRKDVEKLQARKEGEKKGVEVVVFTKNQAVKSGIALLLRLLNARPAEGEVDDGKDAHTSVAEDKEEKTDAREEEQILVVSAQGEGTVKLVGIVDMARRIAAEAARGKHKTGKEARWYMYTVLSSVQMPLRENGSSDAGVERDAEESGEAMHVDTDDEDGAVKETHTSPAEKMKNVPVLSVWLTRKSMVGWKDAFGEEEMVVHNAAGS
ncbi:hypothetical protein N0V86_006290 [Didymella sp. IMI 355093]|nr:hypothetical protein N0V86_006290 [Didymella sp. IMI 355093]